MRTPETMVRFWASEEDIVIHELDEVNFDSDIDVSDVSSVHTSDLSDWDQNLSDFDDLDEGTPVDPPRDSRGWTTHTSPIVIEEFDSEIGPNITDFDPSVASQLDFFLRLFELQTFQDLANQTNEYARQKIALKPNGDPLRREINVTELKAYFGFLILMGIVFLEMKCTGLQMIDWGCQARDQ